MYYGPTLFKSMGYFSVSSQLAATFFLGVTNTLCSVLCLYLVDRIGRRILLITGSGIAALCLFMIAALMPMIETNPELQPMTFLCFIVYIASYCMSVGSLFWLIIAEIFPLPIRGVGMGFSAAVQWAANLLVSMTFLHVTQSFGTPCILVGYGIICVLCSLFCYYKIPETKGIPLGAYVET
jgi:MFS family permease